MRKANLNCAVRVASLHLGKCDDWISALNARIVERCPAFSGRKRMTLPSTDAVHKEYQARDTMRSMICLTDFGIKWLPAFMNVE